MIVSLQLLRFLAAACVLLTHARGEYEGLTLFGAFGVDVFFIISGFIIYVITDKGPSNYLVKRFIRIVPMYWLFTILLSIIAFVAPDLLHSATFDIRHIISSLFFFPYWTEGTGFSPILKLGWTLNYEMAFYAIFYLSMLISHKHRGWIASLLIIFVISFFNFISIEEHSSFIFYSSRTWLEFIFGILLGMNVRKLLTFNNNYFMPIMGVGVAAYLFVYTSYIGTLGLPRYLYWGVPAFIMVVSMLALEHKFDKLSISQKQIIVWLGEVSYPMYLMHIYVIAALHRVIFPSIDFIYLFVASLLLTVIVSSLVSVLFDKPIRNILSLKLIRV
jgi:exopolysaccharide production protein ExoZ